MESIMKKYSKYIGIIVVIIVVVCIAAVNIHFDYGRNILELKLNTEYSTGGYTVVPKRVEVLSSEELKEEYSYLGDIDGLLDSRKNEYSMILVHSRVRYDTDSEVRKSQSNFRIQSGALSQGICLEMYKAMNDSFDKTQCIQGEWYDIVYPYIINEKLMNDYSADKVKKLKFQLVVSQNPIVYYILY